MSFAAVCVTVACLLIVGSFSCLTYNVNILVESLNKTNEIVVYIDSELSEAEARSLTTPINTIDNVYQTRFVTREEALKDFIAEHAGDEAFSGVEASDLRHRIIVVLEDNSRMDQTVTEIKKLSGVANISAAYELAEGFSTLQNILHIASSVIVVVLLVVSLLIISNTVKLAMFDRRDEISIMKMVGATNGFIRLPYVVEGFILGMIGASIAFGLQWLLYDALLVWLEEADSLKLLQFVPFEELLTPMVCIFAAAGLFVGVVGSWTSIRKFLDV
jgi:cell division transport system permease protein